MRSELALTTHAIGKKKAGKSAILSGTVCSAYSTLYNLNSFKVASFKKSEILRKRTIE